MAATLPNPDDCNCDCTTTCEPAQVPGPQGAAGADGTNGTDGVDAVSVVAVQFAIPAQQATVLATFTEPPGNLWMTVGQVVAVQGAGAAGAAGYYQVQSLTGTDQATLLNLRDDVAGTYADNIDGAGNIAVGMQVSPGGVQGPQGVAGAAGGGAPDDATYITQTPHADLSAEQALSLLSTGLMKSTTGTGVVSIVTQGVANGNAAPNDGALTNGDAVFGTANGIETKTAANARTALGLGTMAVQNANNVAITGGTISGVAITTPAGLVSAWLLYTYQEATTVNGAAFPTGAWNTVPLNTEVVDTGGNGSINAGTGVVTLAAGTYRFRWTVSGSATDEFSTRLVEGVATVRAYGSNAKAGQSDTTQDESHGWYRGTVIAGTEVRLEAQANVGAGTYGNANGFGGAEIYAVLEIEKES